MVGNAQRKARDSFLIAPSWWCGSPTSSALPATVRPSFFWDPASARRSATLPACLTTRCVFNSFAGGAFSRRFVRTLEAFARTHFSAVTHIPSSSIVHSRFCDACHARLRLQHSDKICSALENGQGMWGLKGRVFGCQSFGNG